MNDGGRAGFTLIEVSIVLAIIGLIVGGIFVGRDLIKAAEIRMMISQIEKYDVAANTFRTKYGYLPGDLPAAPANSLGFPVRTGVFGDGDGNGYIDSIWFSSGDPGIQGETALFWIDLAGAGFIEDISFIYPNSNSLTVMNDREVIMGRDMSLFLPRTKYGFAGYVTVYGVGNLSGGTGIERTNSYQLIGNDSDWTEILSGQGFIGSGPFTASEAQSIDQKRDDGLPISGRVQAMVNGPAAFLDISLDAAAGYGYVGSPYTDCFQTIGSPVTYNTADAALSGVANCSLRIKAAF